MEKLFATTQPLNNTASIPDDQTTAIPQASTSIQPRIHAFKIGDLGFLLNTEVIISEVCSELSICRLPNTSAYLHGISNHRGNMVPIFNMKKILDIADTGYSKSIKYLLFGQRQQSVGILIHELPSRYHIDENELIAKTPETPEMLTPYVGKCYQQNRQCWFEWDIFSFFMNVSKQIAT